MTHTRPTVSVYAVPAAAFIACALFGTWFADRQMALLDPGAHYPPFWLWFNTASLVTLSAFVPFAWSHAYALKCGRGWLPLLGLLPLLSVFAGVSLPWALRMSLPAFLAVWLFCYLNQSPRTTARHWLALAAILVTQMLFNGYFSPLNTQDASLRVPGAHIPDTAVHALLFRAFIWIKQFSLSSLDYGYWLAAPFSMGGCQAPAMQLLSLLFDSPSADVTAFYLLLHWLFFLFCVIESFGFYLMLNVGLRLNWSISAAFGMLCIFLQEPFFSDMIAVDHITFISDQVIFPLALCAMFCALRENSLFMASLAGAALGAAFLLLAPHAEAVVYTLLCFGVLTLAAAYAMEKFTSWKQLIPLILCCGACFTVISMFYVGPILLWQFGGIFYTQGHSEEGNLGLFQRMRLDFGTQSLLDILISVWAVLSLKKSLRGKELALPMAAFALVILLSPVHSPLLVLESALTRMNANLHPVYYDRRGYYIAFCALLLAAYAMDRANFLTSLSRDMERRYGERWSHPANVSGLLLTAATALCMLLQLWPAQLYNPQHCRYYITLETLLANYPMLKADTANTRLIRDRLGEFEARVEIAEGYGRKYQQLLEQSHIHTAGDLKDEALLYAFARKAAPIIDRFYLDGYHGCIHPAEGRYDWHGKVFEIPNGASLFVGLPNPFMRVAGYTTGEELPLLVTPGIQACALFTGISNGLFTHNSSTHYDARYMIGPPLLHALYLMPGYDFGPMGLYGKKNLIWCQEPDVLLSPLYRKVISISGIDAIMTSRRVAEKLTHAEGFDPLPQTSGAISSLDELMALQNVHSYGMAYLANHINYIDHAAVAATEPILRRQLIKQDSSDAFNRARDFLYAQLNSLREYRDIILEEKVQDGSEDAPAGDVAIRNVIGEATVMKADCKREKCVLVYNLADVPGWHAYADGAPLSITRANFAFMAVTLPKGTHEVWFIYAPASSFLFTLLSLFGLCFLPYFSRKPW